MYQYLSIKPCSLRANELTFLKIKTCLFVFLFGTEALVKKFACDPALPWIANPIGQPSATKNRQNGNIKNAVEQPVVMSTGMRTQGLAAVPFEWGPVYQPGGD